MKKMLKSFMMKLQTREIKERTALEWRLVALSLDRMFFVIYLITIIVAIVTIITVCATRPMETYLDLDKPRDSSWV